MIDSLCPICNNKNNCMAHSEKTCWCLKVKVPQELLELVPEEKKCKVCICLSCIEAYENNPELFIENYKRSL